MGVQETKKEEFLPSFLKKLTSPVNFIWHSLAARGTAEGIMLGVREESLSVVNICYGKYFVCCMLQCANLDFS
jgi:hypothetical protein